jgi:hypothetical protein
VVDEIWKPIKGFENLYLISNTGKVFSLIRNKLKKFSHQKTGYLQVTLCLSGKFHYKYAHRLVAEAFIENKDNKSSVNHKDANKNNNHVSNLEWATEAENNFHAGMMNLKPIGTKHINSKFKKDDLAKIELLLKEGNLTHKKIANLFNVHRTTISRLSRKETYKKEKLNET